VAVPRRAVAQVASLSLSAADLKRLKDVLDDPGFMLFEKILEVRLEDARVKLETCKEDDVQRLQGRVAELRKVLATVPELCHEEETRTVRST